MRRLWNRYNRLSVLVWLLPVISIAFLLQCAGIPEIPGFKGILEGKPPITTSLSDAVTEVPFLDDFDPKVLVLMTVLPRGPNGGFLLRPGLFELNAQSYCLHAGKYVPGGGDGYLFAPLKGPRADIIRNILQRSVDHPEVRQRDIQKLLWAILARTKIGDLSHEMQLTAAKLLTPEEILEINGGALGLIPEELFEKALDELPTQVRQVLEAEARLRDMLTEAKATYEELERVAVRFGDAPLGEGSREVPLGRWSYHPDGYFIRYFPSGYRRTLIQIYVPERFQIERDELGRIKLIADGKGNRIETDYNDTIQALTVPGDPGLQGYAFRSIRFVLTKMSTEKLLSFEAQWKDIGWTLVGIPSSGGHIGSLPERFTDLKQRYEWAKNHKKQLDKLDGQLDSKGSIRDIIDLGHYTLALKNVISGSRAKKTKWAADHIHLVKKAWQSAICRGECGCGAEGVSFGSRELTPDALIEPPMLLTALKSPIVRLLTESNPKENKESKCEYIPSGNDAVPGNTSRQRLGMSQRPSDTRDDDCKDVEDWLENDILALGAYSDPDTLESSDSTDEYEENIGSSEGPFEYGVNADCEYQVNDNVLDVVLTYENEAGLRSYLEEHLLMYGRHVPEAVIDAIMEHERTHMSQCLEDPERYREGFSDPEIRSEFEIEAYCKSIKSMLDYLNQNCGGTTLSLEYVVPLCIMHW
jgi:hypothetical protein